MAAIRNYQPKDRENVRMVCMHTGPGKALLNDGPERKLLLAAYCDYYIEREPQNCFVAADDNDEAVGYILCAEDYKSYRKVFLRDYAPKVKSTGLVQKVEFYGAAILPVFFAEKYPAHLHIDILEDYQRMGLGSRLMDALTAHLRGKGVPGVMLGVGAENKKGRNFYKKYGFKKLLRIPFSVVMGLEL
ncbi:MAG: GNAT family N-acetyltransferase [Oscillospiraceae bacterium]|nr:GNAT family N-acetyltransferase [Oscillospiraceae bacterium]